MRLVRNTVVGRGLFGLAMVAALAFGASQAAAAPAAEKSAERACGPTWCNNICIRGGFEGGYCYGGYDCVCY
ncbi:MAG TPA: hypothetical protein VGC13_05175 [Longimicrobium sp.]|uniref:hypothetical protein n=1 Tax=Longimicrobium sp. TaxID=2029185 RepID=UPI002ED9B6AC